MKTSRIILSLALALVLAACSASSESERKEENIKNAQTNAVAKAAAEREYTKGTPICPQVAVIHELATVRDYGGVKPGPRQLAFEARILGVNGSCKYQDNGIDIAFTADMVAGRGPRLGGNNTEFPFFVAVIDPQQNILNKDQMTAAFHFDRGKNLASHSEPLHVFIPLPKAQDRTGPDYRVLVGFQLTQDQLNDVRAKAKAAQTQTPSP